MTESRILPQTVTQSEMIRNNSPTVALLGSFRFKDRLEEVRCIFESNGIPVLAPAPGNVVKEVQGIKLLDTDEDRAPLEAEASYLQGALNATAVYIIDTDGYIGVMGSVEIGYLHAYGVPLYAFEPINPVDYTGRRSIMRDFLAMAIKVVDPPTLISQLKADALDTTGYPWFKRDRNRVAVKVVDDRINITKI